MGDNSQILKLMRMMNSTPYIEREIEKHIEIEKKREMILEFQRDHQEENQSIKNSKYYWMQNYDASRWNSGSYAGHFQLNYKQTEINNLIFNKVFRGILFVLVL